LRRFIAFTRDIKQRSGGMLVAFYAGIMQDMRK